jgi:hypothetical protein
MRPRIVCALVVAPLIAGGCAGRSDYVTSRDNLGFGTGSTSSAVTYTPPQPVVVEPPTVIQPPVVVQPGQQVVVAPSQPAAVVVPGTQVIQADDLEANEVRAQAIYANRIQATEIRGVVHQPAEVKIARSVADIKAATLVASVLYADTIKADRVIADHIFVGSLERR